MTTTAPTRPAPSRLRAAFDWSVLAAGVLSLGIAVVGTLMTAGTTPGFIEAGAAVTPDAL